MKITFFKPLTISHEIRNLSFYGDVINELLSRPEAMNAMNKVAIRYRREPVQWVRLLLLKTLSRVPCDDLIHTRLFSYNIGNIHL